MTQVNLARAFVFRTHIKKKLRKIHDEISERSLFSEVAEETEPNPSLDELLAFYDKVQEYLVKINTEIDSANNVKVDERTPRSYLNELEALKAKKDLYAEVVCNLSSYRQEKKVFDPHAFNSQTNELGCVVEKHYRMNSSCEFKNELAKVKRMIRITEDKISECNVKVHIGSSFEYWNDVTEELESMI